MRFPCTCFKSFYRPFREDTDERVCDISQQYKTRVDQAINLIALWTTPKPPPRRGVCTIWGWNASRCVCSCGVCFVNSKCSLHKFSESRDVHCSYRMCVGTVVCEWEAREALLLSRVGIKGVCYVVLNNPSVMCSFFVYGWTKAQRNNCNIVSREVECKDLRLLNTHYFWS